MFIIKASMAKNDISGKDFKIYHEKCFSAPARFKKALSHIFVLGINLYEPYGYTNFHVKQNLHP